jgi:hypothetical protein
MFSQMWKSLHVKYPLFLSDFYETGIFSIDFRKKCQISNFFKIRPVRVDLFHADRRIDTGRDMTNLIVAFRNFAKSD